MSVPLGHLTGRGDPPAQLRLYQGQQLAGRIGRVTETQPWALAAGRSSATKKDTAGWYGSNGKFSGAILHSQRTLGLWNPPHFNGGVRQEREP